jgi:hypothetical protein
VKKKKNLNCGKMFSFAFLNRQPRDLSLEIKSTMVSVVEKYSAQERERLPKYPARGHVKQTHSMSHGPLITSA